MSVGELKEAATLIQPFLLYQIKSCLWAHGTNIFYHRGLVNGVLAWIFLYVDIISRENGAHKRGDVVLVALAYYGTGYLVLKTILAIYHHFKWIIVMLCRKEFNVQSKQKVDSHWELSNNKWIKIQ
jgi:hypothetical protein